MARRCAVSRKVRRAQGAREARQSFGKEPAGAEGVTTEELANAKPPRDPVATPREIGERPGIMTVEMPGRHITGRASDLRLGGGDHEGELGVRVVEVTGIKVESDGFRQKMGERVSNLHRCSNTNSSMRSPVNIHRRRQADRPHQNCPRARFNLQNASGREDIRRRSSADHLGRLEEDGWGNGQAQRLGGLEIDH